MMSAEASDRAVLEQVTKCLWCGSDNLAACIDGVGDWFFGAMPGAFAFEICEGCASLVLKERPEPDRIGAAYEGYYTRTSGDAAALQEGGSKSIRNRLTSAYARSHHGPNEAAIDALLALPLNLVPQRKLALQAWYRFLPKARAEVLDYGCGNGDFLARAAALGHRVTGVDLDEEALRISASRGFEVHLSDMLDPEDFDGRFDFISANHVIEHVPDPRKLLAGFHRWLKPDGRLYIECPNAEAEGLGRFGNFWRGLEAPRHFSLPSRAAMERALGEAGFQRIEWHDRKDVSAEMAAQSRAAMQRHAATEPKLPRAGRFDDTEFLTLVAHRDG